MRTRAGSAEARALCLATPHAPPSHHHRRLHSPLRRKARRNPQQRPPPGEPPGISSRSAFYDAARVQWSPTPPLWTITAFTVCVRKQRVSEDNGGGRGGGGRPMARKRRSERSASEQSTASPQGTQCMKRKLIHKLIHTSQGLKVLFKVMVC